MNSSFLEIAKQFKVVFFDSYGVLKHAGGVIEGACKTIELLKAEGVEIRVLTNDASRSRGAQADKFRALGYNGIRSGEIITSGHMASRFLRDKIQQGKVAYLGTEKSACYIKDVNCEPVAMRDIKNPEDIKAIVFLDDEGFDWASELNIAVNIIRNYRVPVVVANTDKLYPASQNTVAIATGGIARLIQMLVRTKFLYFGKPDTQMFNYAFDDVNLNDTYRKDEILMVGDTLQTDILGGNKFGIKTCLVLSGNVSARNYINEIDQSGIIPDFVCPSIGC